MWKEWNQKRDKICSEVVVTLVWGIHEEEALDTDFEKDKLTLEIKKYFPSTVHGINESENKWSKLTDS